MSEQIHRNMEKFKLSDETREKIKGHPFLIAKIATELNISTSYTLRLIRQNDRNLTQKAVIQLIVDDLALTESEIFSGGIAEAPAV